MKPLAVSFVAFLLLSNVAWGAVLENPAPNSIQSGIGVVSGWKCDATRVEVVFDAGAPIEVAYGTTRGDTREVCGDDNNGFGLLWNWNLLGAGSHTVRVLDNGVEFARASITVVSPGEEFLTGLSGEALAPRFPSPEVDTVLTWQESLQNFVITGSQPRDFGRDVCRELFIERVFNSGQFVELEDGTVWEVAPADRLNVRDDWFPSDSVLLCFLSDDFGDVRTLINLELREDNIIQVTRG